MPASTPAHDSSTSPRRKLPLLARHAISLGVVFVLALPLSYVGLRYYFQQQKLSQLDQPDDAAFNAGLAYIYAHAAEREPVAQRATDRIATLPTDRAVELHRVLLRAFVDEVKAVPRPVVDAGIALMGRVEMPEAVMVYRHTADAGIEGEDPALLAALNKHFAVESPSRFLQLVEFYDSQAMWSWAKVPAEAWLRWLVTLSHSPAETTQRQTARRLGELPEQADAPEIKEALTRLSQSEHPHVRAQVLKSVAGYARIADDPTSYEQILFTLGEDENKVIARRAWMIVGHLNPYSGFSPNWQTADPYVAEAILWAAVKTNPDQVQPAIDAWESGNAQFAIMALYERGQTTEDGWGKPGKLMLDVLDSVPSNEEELLLFWRTLPHLHRDWESFVYGKYQIKSFENLIKATESEQIRQKEYSSLIAASCYYCCSGYKPSLPNHDISSYLMAWAESLHLGPSEAHETLPVYLESVNAWINERTPPAGDAFDPFYDADNQNNIDPAEMENPFHKTSRFGKNLYRIIAQAADPWLYYQSVDFDAMPTASTLWRNLWLAANYAHISVRAHAKQDSHLKIIDDSIRSNDSFESTCAALLAGLHGTYPKLIQSDTTRFANFLRSSPDITDDQLHAMTDAELAKHGLKRVDAIQALLEVVENNPDLAERYETTSLLKLALWMRGDLGDEFTATAEGMLLDPRLPTSTVLLALLHKQRPIALEYLFGDLVQPSPDLHKLFIQERFWHVFRRFVKTDDLDLWLWGDPAAQDFQIEAMRQWYWVNRWELNDVWLGE